MLTAPLTRIDQLNPLADWRGFFVVGLPITL
jgi:hypothetical protein